jgi:type IV pilus assembly protein PilW
LRSAGYLGCAKIPRWFTSTLNNPTETLWNYFTPMAGYETDGEGTFAPALDIALDPAPVNESDVVVTRSVLREGRALTVQTDLTGPTAEPTVLDAAVAGGAAGQVFVITDCESSTVFQASSYTTGSPNGTVSHVTGGANPGNSTNDLGYTYRRMSRLIPLQTYTYYVGLNPDNNEPGLYRKTGDTGESELLVEGVQALQVAYAVDTTGDRIADAYVTADGVDDWNEVISVTLALLVRSEESGTSKDEQTYQLLPDEIGGLEIAAADDRRQRMLFTTTVAVRNRAL